MAPLVKTISANETRPLRQMVLRPHQAQKDLIYPNDMHELTLHVGAFEGDQLIGIASVYNEDLEHRLGTGGWRLRGMAVLPEFRGKKIGQSLLFACVRHAQERGALFLWCNARSTAVGFYEACGFKKQGDEFDISGIGPHYVMVKDLK